MLQWSLAVTEYQCLEILVPPLEFYRLANYYNQQFVRKEKKKRVDKYPSAHSQNISCDIIYFANKFEYLKYFLEIGTESWNKLMQQFLHSNLQNPYPIFVCAYILAAFFIEWEILRLMKSSEPILRFMLCRI